jgi:hypothetical protein
MKIEKNKKINEAIDLLIEGGADLKTVEAFPILICISKTLC